MLKHKHHKDNAVIPLTGTTITSEQSGLINPQQAKHLQLSSVVLGCKNNLKNQQALVVTFKFE